MSSTTSQSIDTDTIVAIASAPGRGGIGVVRLSGPAALVIAQKLCGKSEPIEPRAAVFSSFRDGTGEVIDSGLCLCFPQPASFTGEDVAELQGHGSPVVLDRIVQTAIASGARMARPGEFSERAYLNGKMDLAQAEAVADLINAASEESAQAAVRSLRGEFSALMNQLSADLVALRVQVEAAIDFPDEDIELLSAPGVIQALTDLIASVGQIVERTRSGVRLTEGARLVLVGAPNVGKSSVLNRLCGEERAIVTPVAGTTRDLVREQLLLQGIPVELVDTAGMRQTSDLIETEGVRRAETAAREADLILAVHDLTAPATLEFLLRWLEQEFGSLTESQRSLDRVQELPALVIVANKLDCVEAAEQATSTGLDIQSELALTYSTLSKDTLKISSEVLLVSAKTGEGIQQLTEHLVQRLNGGSMATGVQPVDTYSARSRHLLALKDALAGLTQAHDGIHAQLDAELVAEHLRHAQADLASVCGEITTDELLGEIFGSFCIGK